MAEQSACSSTTTTRRSASTARLAWRPHSRRSQQMWRQPQGAAHNAVCCAASSSSDNWCASAPRSCPHTPTASNAASAVSVSVPEANLPRRSALLRDAREAGFLPWRDWCLRGGILQTMALRSSMAQDSLWGSSIFFKPFVANTSIILTHAVTSFCRTLHVHFVFLFYYLSRTFLSSGHAMMLYEYTCTRTYEICTRGNTFIEWHRNQSLILYTIDDIIILTPIRIIQIKDSIAFQN